MEALNHCLDILILTGLVTLQREDLLQDTSSTLAVEQLAGPLGGRL